MKAVSGREMARILERKGWKLAQVADSHHIFIAAGRRERISLPIHGNQSLRNGLQRSVMKIAGIAEDEL